LVIQGAWNFGTAPALTLFRTSRSMAKPDAIKLLPAPLTQAFLPSCLWFFLIANPAYGQQVAKAAAGADSVSATTASSLKSAVVAAEQTAEDKNKSPHLLVATVPRPEFANRRTLEQNAGKHPAKLLIRSTPSAAQVWVNGMVVGTTPLLLMVAPGEYRTELRGQRMEYAERWVDLLPDETRTVTLPLSARYPTHATMH